MSPEGAALVAGAAGAGIAWLGARWAMASPPAWSLRTNVSGAEVPVVLGLPVAIGGLLPLPFLTLRDGVAPRPLLAAGVVVAVMAAAGRWDDRRGDEPARGFAGHLSAGRLTGGLVKIAAGGLAGVAAGRIVHPDDTTMIVLTALAVPLAANLVNLLDRAPGRAGKAGLVIALPLLLLGDAGWRYAAASTVGALLAVLPADLGERGMLGDAGANPVGALLGLGLAVSLDPGPLAGAIGVLLALNLASERWSFSRVIERTPLLRKLDAIGRK